MPIYHIYINNLLAILPLKQAGQHSGSYKIITFKPGLPYDIQIDIGPSGWKDRN